MKIIRNAISCRQTKTLRVAFVACFLNVSVAQVLTSSPYSRYGIGELNTQTFASSAGMGGSFIAYHQDSIAPFFINAANPAGLAGLRLSTFELGGQGQFTTIRSGAASIQKKNINFSYASLGFPIKKLGGIAFGIMPYSTVGYKITSTEDVASVGQMTYVFQGEGGINKVFLGSGIRPFQRQLTAFYNSSQYDTLVKYQQTDKFKRIRFGKQLLSQLSIGATANYLFGTINQTTHVLYPGSITYYNSKRERTVQISDFTMNGGIQTHFTIDSVRYHGADTLRKGHRVALKQKMNIGIGCFASAPMSIRAQQSSIIYNYAIDGLGVEKPKDTILNSQNNPGMITLPLEVGLGFSVKKGESLTWLLDAATTHWSGFKYFDTQNNVYKNSYRLSMGLNYVPNKLAYGSSSYLQRVQYRVGASYSNGYLDLKNTRIPNYCVTAGLGLPVGTGRFDDIAIVNISAQYGKMGTLTNSLLQEEYVRLILGFSFNKRWFIKYKYD